MIKPTERTFFGTLEIDVPHHILKTNNDVSVTFPDSKGRVSSMVLSVESYDAKPFNPQTLFLGEAHNVPGKIQAEDYDLGGNQVAYFDVNAGNTGGQYRSDSVDITNTNGQYIVGWIANDEWMEYAVNVERDGFYDVDLQFASGTSNGGRVRLEIDGVDVSGGISLPYTGSWRSYETVSLRVKLSAGEHVLRVYSELGGMNLDFFDFKFFSSDVDSAAVAQASDLNFESGSQITVPIDYDLPEPRLITVQFSSPTGAWLGQLSKEYPAGVGTLQSTVPFRIAPEPGSGYIISTFIRPIGGGWDQMISFTRIKNATITEPSAQQPYADTPISLPGTIQIENYDLGGAGVAYYDSTAKDFGGDGRTGDSVDIRKLSASNKLLGWTANGEWLEYTVIFNKTANYRFKARVASPSNASGKLGIEVSGVKVISNSSVINTGGYNTYQTQSLGSARVSAGRHTILVNIEKSGFNLDFLEIEEITP